MWPPCRSAGDGEELPVAGDALELVPSSVFEVDARADRQISDGARREDLAGPGERGDARRDMDGHAADVLADDLALAGVEPRAQVDPERPDGVADGPARLHGARGTVER